MTVKIFIGIAIILVSFVYIMKNHDKSLMDWPNRNPLIPLKQTILIKINI